jgi:hypothetical protein
MSNSTILFSDCFEYSQKALASKQMDEKALVDLMLHIDGKTMEEVKVILAESLTKLEGDAKKAVLKIEEGVTAELSKAQAAVLEVRDVADVKKVVEEVSVKCSWCIPLFKKAASS